MSARYEGEVYYNDDAKLHLKSFQNKNGGLCKHDERTRFAYLLVSKDEAKKLVGSLTDDKAVVDAVKGKYASVLKKAIDAEEAEYVQANKKLRDVSRKEDDKLVHLLNAPSYNVTSKAKALLAKGFSSAAENVKQSEEDGGEKINVTYLFKNKTECDEDIEAENGEFSRKDLSQDQKEAYVLVSMPYVYNYILKDPKSNKIDVDFVLTSYENEVGVSIMPKLQVEFGVFFDGTNNNMYNIDFFQDFKKYVMTQIAFIREKLNPSYDLTKDQFAREFLTHPAEKNDTIMNYLRNEIISDMRYFEHESLKDTLDQYLTNSGKATKDSDKLFKLFVEVYQVHNHIKDGFFEGIMDRYNNLSGLNTDILDDEKKLDKFIGEYLVKEILPSSSDNSSYTNGYTNVKRLYEHYKGEDQLRRHYDKSLKNLKSFRLYASGSGTIDPVKNISLDDDSLFGLGLGTGVAGVKAHIIYSCEKIAKQLRQQNITHIDELVLDVFGFSRGATSARHFVCTLMKEFELLNQDGYLEYALDTEKEGKNAFSPFYEEDGLYTYIDNKPHFNPFCKGIAGAYMANEQRDEDAELVINDFHALPEISIKSLSFRHANIGDTVTHYGFKQSDDSKELNIHFEASKIGSVFHIMAMDEYRYNFEAHSIFESEYEGIKHEVENFKEFLVPGAHADVGGGYQESPSEELVLYPSGTTEKELKAWNKTYAWIAEDKYDSFDEDDISDRSKVGGYVISQKQHSNHGHKPGNLGYTRKHIYMYRTGLSWEYELVCMKLMHAEAVSKDREEESRVPLKEIMDQYSLDKAVKEDKSSSEKEHLLVRVYKALAEFKRVGKEDHQKLRQKYVHQSSNLHTLKNAIANKPSSEGDSGVYGQRVIYGSTGKKFGFKDFS